jgi:flagellar hook-basal body complex protein FliE
MPIKGYADMQSTLRNYGASNWSKTAELNSYVDLKSPLINEDTNNQLDQLAGKEVKSFGQMLQDSIGKVNDLQHQADFAMQRLASGESKNLHETLLAVEKAEIAFKTMNQVRTKVIDAYREIMKMQV